jgi:hypothetical protein
VSAPRWSSPPPANQRLTSTTIKALPGHHAGWGLSDSRTTPVARRYPRAQLICCREDCDVAFVQIRSAQRFCSPDCQTKAKNDGRTPTGNRPGRPRRVIRTEPTPAHRDVPLLRQGIKLEWKAAKSPTPSTDQSFPDLQEATSGQGQHSPLDPDQGFLDPSPRRFNAVRPAAGSNPSRVKTLLDMAHSRGGIGAWEITELAHLRGIDPSAPLRTIFARGM